MSKESTRRRLARATALAHHAVAKATRTIMRAHRSRLGPLNELARAYLAEADAEEDDNAAEGLRRHASFAQKFVSLTNNEITALERELERTALEATIAEARSRGESPSHRYSRRQPVSARAGPARPDRRRM